MVAVPAPRFRSSILETLIERARVRKKTRAKRARPSVLVLLLLALADSAGTVMAAAALTLGGFLVAAWLGCMLLAPCLLVLDYELTSAVKRRATR